MSLLEEGGASSGLNVALGAFDRVLNPLGVPVLLGQSCNIDIRTVVTAKLGSK